MAMRAAVFLARLSATVFLAAAVSFTDFLDLPLLDSLRSLK